MINFQGEGENKAKRVKAHSSHPPRLGYPTIGTPYTAVCAAFDGSSGRGEGGVLSMLLLPRSCWRPVTLWWMWAESMIPQCIAMTTTRGVCLLVWACCRGAYMHTHTYACSLVSTSHPYMHTQRQTQHTPHMQYNT